ncbi:MAG: response regulator transcription factor [Bacteroidales bacterium]|nr:response regulator transcription factor [Bacteroidales bacterium]
MKNTRILLAEDDSNLGNLLKNYLTVKNYETELFINGIEALKAFMKEHYDIFILDIMMPEMDGLTLAREIRKTRPEAPIIFLTAKSQKDDIIEGFKTGADDYIVKPFSMEELLYRIQAILKRTASLNNSRKQESYNIGRYTFDTVKQLLVFENEVINLTTKESELLELLCRYGKDILERNFALRSIWIDDNYFNARSMDVYITRLRKYLKKDPEVRILNVHGKGYKLIC